MAIHCELCGEMIVKYKMDLGDTVVIEVGGVIKYICDDCARDIAKQLIDR